MKTRRRRYRLPPRLRRRPVSSPATRAQFRQKLERIRVLYRLEAILELSQVDPDADRLAQLSHEAGTLDEVLVSLEEQP
jgi:hypothetical protein